MVTETKFMQGISFEENPFADETPEETKFYDQDGNEVTVDGNE